MAQRTMIRWFGRIGLVLGSLVLVLVACELVAPDVVVLQLYLNDARDAGIFVVDLLSPLRAHRQSTGDEELFDQCHLTPIGHGIVADAMVRWLNEEELLPPARVTDSTPVRGENE